MTAHYDRARGADPRRLHGVHAALRRGLLQSDRVATAKTFFAEPKHAPPGTSTELSRVAEAVGDCVGLDAREGEAVRRYITADR